MSDKKVVLLSQEDFLTQTIEIALRQKGQSIVSFDNFNEALPFLKDLASNFIIDASFLNAISEAEQAQLKEILLPQTCPILILVLATQQASIEQLLSPLAPVHYLHKPLAPAQLWTKLAKH